MKIKICGVFRECDCEYINEFMPEFTGLVFYKKSHRFLNDSTAQNLRCKINKDIQTAGVFVDEDMEHIEYLYKNGIISIIQLHGHEDEQYIKKLRNILPQAEIWKAFKIREKSDLYAAENSSADRILLDNGYGTGKCFDWKLIDNFKRDFILAGGITPENIKDAIDRFSPWAIDVSSGVETDKLKDKNKIAAVIAAVKEIGSDKNV